MATGKTFGAIEHSPIIDAIALAESGTTGEIRVHLSKRFFERDAFGRAERLFGEFGMSRTTQRNAVLLYVNLRRRKIAVVGDTGIDQAIGDRSWKLLINELEENLRSTHPERAIAIAVLTLGAELRKHFPAERTSS